MQNFFDSGNGPGSSSHLPHRASDSLTVRRRRAQHLEIKGRLRLVADPTSTAQVHRVTICELSGRGAMVLVDLPAGARLALFEKVRYCLLEFEDCQTFSDQIVAKTVWLQPQTSAGDYMTFRIGLSFEDITPDVAARLTRYAAGAV